MQRVSFCLTILWTITAIACIEARGQDSTPKKEEPAAKRFAEIHKTWKDLDAQLDKVVNEFRGAPEAKKAELRKEYEKLADAARKLTPKLTQSAREAYIESPNTDKTVTETLVGMAAADVYRDDYPAALKLATLLLEKKCQDKSLFSLAGMAAFCTHDFSAAEKYLQRAEEEESLTASGKRYLAMLQGGDIKEHWERELKIRAAEKEKNDLPRVKLATSKGDIVIELFENEAPQATANFVHLVESKFYDGLTFHRVLGNFMAQGGCPNGDGKGGPGYSIYCECHKEGYRRHFSGTLSMAHAGRDTGGSQFFLTFRPTPHLDGRHTAFGRVIQGLDVLTKLQRIDPGRPGPKPDTIKKATVLRRREHKYEPTKVK